MPAISTFHKEEKQCLWLNLHEKVGISRRECLTELYFLELNTTSPTRMPYKVWVTTCSYQSVHRSVNQSINQSINPLTNQSINRSINRSIKQSIN